MNARQQDVNRQIGRFIRRARRSKDMTLSDLATAAGLPYWQLVQKYETGALTIPAAKLFDIANALGMSIQWLFPVGGSLSKNNQTISDDGARRQA